MSTDATPAGEGEFVFRLIHSTYFNAHLSLPVQPAAFRPLDDEPEGISVIQASLASVEQALEVVPEGKRDRYCVARIPVAELRAIGLSISPDADGSAHAVIPELNSTAYRQDKPKWKLIQKVLAEIASRNIVHRLGQ